MRTHPRLGLFIIDVIHSSHEGEPGTKGHKDTLPSSENPTGALVGIGSLPGDISEESVAKLPEERRQENLPSHEAAEEPLGKTDGVGPLPGAPSESGVALAPEEHRQEDLPSHETADEPLGKTGGVGPLPGASSESGVALAPEERTHPQGESVVGSVLSFVTYLSLLLY